MLKLRTEANETHVHYFIDIKYSLRRDAEQTTYMCHLRSKNIYVRVSPDSEVKIRKGFCNFRDFYSCSLCSIVNVKLKIIQIAHVTDYTYLTRIMSKQLKFSVISP